MSNHVIVHRGHGLLGLFWVVWGIAQVGHAWVSGTLVVIGIGWRWVHVGHSVGGALSCSVCMSWH